MSQPRTQLWAIGQILIRSISFSFALTLAVEISILQIDINYRDWFFIRSVEIGLLFNAIFIIEVVWLGHKSGKFLENSIFRIIQSFPHLLSILNQLIGLALLRLIIGRLAYWSSKVRIIFRHLFFHVMPTLCSISFHPWCVLAVRLDRCHHFDAGHTTPSLICLRRITHIPFSFNSVNVYGGFSIFWQFGVLKHKVTIIISPWAHHLWEYFLLLHQTDPLLMNNIYVVDRHHYLGLAWQLRGSRLLIAAQFLCTWLHRRLLTEVVQILVVVLITLRATATHDYNY